MGFQRKIKRNAKVTPEVVKFCFQVNNDEMLFFPSEDEMFRYLSEYRNKIPIYQLSMFKVEFYQIK